MITAKVVCQSKLETGAGDSRQVVVTFVPDYNDGRNKEWSLYTPALGLSLTLRGPVADQFAPSRPYTLTFEESTE